MIQDDRVIVYKEGDDLMVVYPTGELSIEAVAIKDVPSGFPYKIIKKSELPSDRTFREAWNIDDTELADGVGHGEPLNEGEEQ